MKTSLIVKYSKLVLTTILIVAPLIIAYKMMKEVLIEEITDTNDTQANTTDVNGWNFGCGQDLLINMSFALTMALFWNTKEPVHIGVI